MYNIVCLKFGTKYGPEYVNRLFYGVRRNLTLPFRFHCFTEDDSGLDENIEIHHLPYQLPGVGWWQKLYLFSKDVQINGRIFYIDLDTIVTGNIDELVSLDKGFIVLHDFFAFRNKRHHDKWGNWKESVGSGVMSWETGKHTHIWETFIENPQSAIDALHPHGDQKWIQQQQKERLYFQDMLPGQVISYKVHCKKGLPNDARLVCYHGKPSIPESISKTVRAQNYIYEPATWVEKYWYDE